VDLFILEGSAGRCGHVRAGVLGLAGRFRSFLQRWSDIGQQCPLSRGVTVLVMVV